MSTPLQLSGKLSTVQRYMSIRSVYHIMLVSIGLRWMVVGLTEVDEIVIALESARFDMRTSRNRT